MEFLKNKLVVILGFLNIVFLIIAVGSCSQSKQCIDVKHKEEIKRFDAEKELNQIAGEKAALESKLQLTESALAQVKTEAESTQKSLTQEQLINKSLKAELDKMGKLNAALEQDLKNALVSGKTAEKPKK